MLSIRYLHFDEKKLIELDDSRRRACDGNPPLHLKKLFVDNVESNECQDIDETTNSHEIRAEFYIEDEYGGEDTLYDVCTFNIDSLSNNDVIIFDNHYIDTFFNDGFFAIYFPRTICIIRSKNKKLYTTTYQNNGIVLGIDGDTALFFKDGKMGIGKSNFFSINYCFDEIFNYIEDNSGASFAPTYYKMFESRTRFNNKTFIVRKGGNYGIINDNGFELVPCNFEGIKDDCVIVCGKIARFNPITKEIGDLFDDIQIVGRIRIGIKDNKISFWDYFDRYYDEEYEDFNSYTYYNYDIAEPSRSLIKYFYSFKKGDEVRLINYYGQIIVILNGYDIIDVYYDDCGYFVWGTLDVEEMGLTSAELFNDFLLYRNEGIVSKKLDKLKERFFAKGLYDIWYDNFNYSISDEDIAKYELFLYVTKNSKIGIADKTGKLVVPVVYDDKKSAYECYRRTNLHKFT